MIHKKNPLSPHIFGSVGRAESDTSDIVRTYFTYKQFQSQSVHDNFSTKDKIKTDAGTEVLLALKKYAGCTAAVAPVNVFNFYIANRLSVPAADIGPDGIAEQVLRGGICPLTMRTEKIPIAVFVDGEIMECGKDYSKYRNEEELLLKQQMYFDRCVDFLTLMIEKYGGETELPLPEAIKPQADRVAANAA